MNIGATGGMPPMMGRPNPADMTDKIMGKADSDGDGAISAEELEALGKKGERISGADSDGDGTVTAEELTNMLTEKMESGEGMPPPPMMAQMEDVTMNSFKDLLASMLENDESEVQDTSELIRDYLSQLGLNQDEVGNFMEVLQSKRFDVTA